MILEAEICCVPLHQNVIPKLFKSKFNCCFNCTAWLCFTAVPDLSRLKHSANMFPDITGHKLKIIMVITLASIFFWWPKFVMFLYLKKFYLFFHVVYWEFLMD